MPGPQYIDSIREFPRVYAGVNETSADRVEEFLKNRNYKDLRGSENIYGESIYTARFETFGKYELNSKLSFSFSFNNHNQDSFYGLTPFNANQTIGFGQLVWNKNIKRHDILIGLAYRYTYYDDDTIATFNDVSKLNHNHKERKNSIVATVIP